MLTFRRHLAFLAIAFSAVTLLAGCFASTTGYYNPEQLKDVQAETARAAETYSTTFYSKRTESEAVELYYFLFHPLNAPDGLTQWEHHFKIAPASSPTWSYDKLFKVVYFQRKRDDTPALAAVQRFASERGGDGVVDLYRRAILSKDRLPAYVVAYEYEGIVVRRKP